VRVYGHQAVSNGRKNPIITPRNIQSLDALTFSNLSNILISIETNNLNFVVGLNFLLDSTHRKLIKYLGIESHIIIHCPGQYRCLQYFLFCNSLSLISPQTDSELIDIKSKSSSYSSLKSIAIPHHGQFRCLHCFSDCNSLSLILFKTDLELRRLEDRAFAVALLCLTVVGGPSYSLMAVDFHSLVLLRCLGLIQMRNSVNGTVVVGPARGIRSSEGHNAREKEKGKGVI
jgi:hypothetical protein